MYRSRPVMSEVLKDFDLNVRDDRPFILVHESCSLSLWCIPDLVFPAQTLGTKHTCACVTGDILFLMTVPGWSFDVLAPQCGYICTPHEIRERFIELL